MKKIVFALLIITVLIVAYIVSLIYATKLSAYDTSIVGYVGKHAYLEFTPTNVFLHDGRNPPVHYGIVTNSSTGTIWHAIGGSTWTITQTRRGLLCTDNENVTNKFLLKNKSLAAVRGKILDLVQKFL